MPDACSVATDYGTKAPVNEERGRQASNENQA